MSPGPGRDTELVGAGLTVAMGAMFATVVILGDGLLRGERPFALLALRFGGTAVALLAINTVTGRPLLPAPGERLGAALAGTLGYGTESALYFSALNHGTAAAVTLLFYTYPVIVTLATVTIDRRLPSGLVLGALGLAVVGSAIVVVGGGGVDVTTTGIVLSLACATAYSAYLMGADRVFRRTEPMTSAWALAAGAAVANATFALVFGGNAIPQGPTEWLRVAGMAAFTLGAFVAMLAALRRIGAVRNAIIGVIEPLTVAVLAWVFLAQPVTWSVAVGGVAILGGAVLATVARAPTRSPAPEPNL